jgi:hypothetical protein
VQADCLHCELEPSSDPGEWSLNAHRIRELRGFSGIANQKPELPPAAGPLILCASVAPPEVMDVKKRIFGGVVVVVVIAIVVAVFYLFSNLNSIVAKAIEQHGSEVTQTKVGVSAVDISLREGRGTIKGLNIASPAGFRAHEAFTLGDITVDIDLGSVRKDPIVLDEVVIKAPVVHAEVTKKGASNIDELRKRVQSYSAASEGSSAGAQKQKKLCIKTFLFEEGRVEVDATALGVEKKTITLPEIRLNNVGGTNGSPPDEITQEILTAVAKKVTSEIAHSEINGLIQKQLGGSLPDKAEGLLKKIGIGGKK